MEFSIVTISMFVAALNEVTKMIAKTFGYKINRLIPIFSLVYGVALGIIGYFTPNVAMGNNLVEAIFIGLSAGAASTGCHQVYKQLSKKEFDDIDPSEDEELSDEDVEVDETNAELDDSDEADK